MTAYYNEFDPYAAQWLRNLIAAGHIAPGVVDERSISEVQPDELKGYTQCHFFAGIGVWSHALRSAGWDDARPVWTGSCPCQPFSSAGRRLGTADERHLWPTFAKLIAECRPATVFGEQVASGAGRDWLAVVRADLEGMGYAVGAADLCAAGTGAPHIRQRLYWVADAGCTRGQRRPNASGPSQADAGQWQQGATDDQPRSGTGGLADAVQSGWAEGRTIARSGQAASGSGSSGLADATSSRLTGSSRSGGAQELGAAERSMSCGLADSAGGLVPQPRRRPQGRDGARPNGADDATSARGPSTPDGFWAASDWLWCRDGKWRPVESGTEPLAHGIANRVGRLRAYGNALCAPVAEAFVRAYLASEHLCTPPVD